MDESLVHWWYHLRVMSKGKTLNNQMGFVANGMSWGIRGSSSIVSLHFLECQVTRLRLHTCLPWLKVSEHQPRMQLYLSRCLVSIHSFSDPFFKISLTHVKCVFGSSASTNFVCLFDALLACFWLAEHAKPCSDSMYQTRYLCFSRWRAHVFYLLLRAKHYG